MKYFLSKVLPIKLIIINIQECSCRYIWKTNLFRIGLVDVAAQDFLEVHEIQVLDHASFTVTGQFMNNCQVKLEKSKNNGQN